MKKGSKVGLKIQEINITFLSSSKVILNCSPLQHEISLWSFSKVLRSVLIQNQIQRLMMKS